MRSRIMKLINFWWNLWFEALGFKSQLFSIYFRCNLELSDYRKQVSICFLWVFCDDGFFERPVFVTKDFF